MGASAAELGADIIHSRYNFKASHSHKLNYQGWLKDFLPSATRKGFVYVLLGNYCGLSLEGFGFFWEATVNCHPFSSSVHCAFVDRPGPSGEFNDSIIDFPSKRLFRKARNRPFQLQRGSIGRRIPSHFWQSRAHSGHTALDPPRPRSGVECGKRRRQSNPFARKKKKIIHLYSFSLLLLLLHPFLSLSLQSSPVSVASSWR